MNTLDLIVLAVIALSALFAFVRGFVREALSIAAWIGAGIVTYEFVHLLQPTFRKMITAVWLADLSAGFVLFVVSLLLFSIVVGLVSSQVRAAGLGALDRSLGLLFGLARGAFLLCLGYLLLPRVLPEESWPPWIAQARSRPMLAYGAAQLQQLVPRQMIEHAPSSMIRTGQSMINAGEAIRSLQTATDPEGKPAPPPPAANDKPQAPAPGYTPDERRELDRALEQMGGKK